MDVCFRHFGNSLQALDMGNKRKGLRHNVSGPFAASNTLVLTDDDVFIV